MQAIISIGIPGSGKSTLLKPVAAQKGLAYINRDDIREELTGDSANHTRESEVTKLMYQKIAEGLRGKGVVVDATHSKAQDRRQMIDFCREHGAYKIIGCWFNVPFQTALEQNRARERMVPERALDVMQNRLELNPPTLAEGFDRVIETV